MYQKFNAVVVEPDAGARIRLREATRSCLEFDNIFQASELADALDIMRGDEITDIIFISSRINRHHITDFLDESSDILRARDAARILLLDTSTQGSSSVASRMLEGIDGFLIEPYSVDALQEITKLASVTKRKRAVDREEAALGYLLKEIMAQIDQISLLQKAGAPANISIRSLQEMCSVLHTLNPLVHQRYIELILEKFPLAKPAEEVSLRGSYTGPSQRVRKKMADKAIFKVKTAFAVNS